MPSLTIAIPSNPYGHPMTGSLNWNVTSAQDNLVEEGNETITVHLASATGDIILRPYGVPPQYAPPEATSATLTIMDDPPIVSIEAIDPDATENAEGEDPDPGQLLVHRTGGLVSVPITVYYDVGGSATEGVDYATLPHEVAVGSEAVIDISVIDDPDAEGIETAEVTLAADQDPICNYLTRDPDRAIVRRDDNTSVSPTQEGTPQGGPLSPLLSNLVSEVKRV